MGAIATTVEEQIQKLTNRGLVLDWGEDKAKEVLLDIGYYRLGFYWNPFEKNRKHDFQDQTKFSDALTLYYLDVDLRNILLKCLNRIEINFRTNVVYYASNKYLNATWFADKKVVKSEFAESFSKHYDSYFIDNNKPIKKHHQKYINDKYAPAWKTLEFFTFGTIFKIYRSFNDENIKLEIADKFGFKHLKTFENYVSTIVFIRNTCAHGGILFDLNTPTGIRITPLINFGTNHNYKHSLDSCIKIILYFLNTISSTRKVEVETQIENLFNKAAQNQVIKKIFEDKMGYQKINT